MLLSHRKRLLQLWRICAKYRLDTHLPIEEIPQLKRLARLIRLHPASTFKRHQPLGVKLALEEMGTLFLKLGQLLSTRRDLVPPEVIEQLVLLQDRVKPFEVDVLKAQIADNKYGLGQDISEIFSRFDEVPLAAASIAQVHTASLMDGREVVVKVTRPNIRPTIIQDFELLRDFAQWASVRIESARAVHIIDVVEEYRQVMLNELDLELEADNTRRMKANFTGSSMMYVPEVYYDSKNVMVMERINGLPISQTDTFDKLGYDRAKLAEKGLTIFFTQVFRDNFFHADMHPGNIFVELPIDSDPSPNFEPRYMGLDCAIMGELSKDDQLVVARLLLSVMNSNYTALVDIIYRAGWIPPNTDKHALMRDMRRTVSPMVQKPINEIDFAGVLMSMLDIARRHQMSIPPQLMLLLKTLVHVEGLGRDLYPDLDIWSLAKPILTSWVKEQLDPMRNLQQIREQLPELLLSATDLPKLLDNSLQSLSDQGSRQDKQLREIQQVHADMLNNRRSDWIALTGFAFFIAMAVQAPNVQFIGYPLAMLAPVFYFLAVCFALWRIIG